MKDLRAAVARFYDLDREPLTGTRTVACHYRRGRVSVQPLIICPDLIYRVREGAKLVEEVVFPLVMRCYFPDDFANLFAKHGFDVGERVGRILR